jgi:hypothetical protein
VIKTLLHIAAGACGLVLATIALFLTENEEGELQNRLEVLWIRVDDLSKTAMTKEAALVQQASKMLSTALDRLFGARLLSWNAIATSVGFSIASLYLCLYFSAGPRFHHSGLAFFLFIASIVIAIAPGRWRYASFVWIFVAYIEVFIQEVWDWDEYSEKYSSSGLFLWDYVRNPYIARSKIPYVIFGTVVGGVVSDLLIIILLRWLLSKASELRSTWKLIGFVLLESCMGLIIVTPLLLPYRLYSAENNVFRTVSILALAMAGSNVITASACLLIVVLLALALLHRATWRVLSRPIYAAQRHGLVSHPGFLAKVSGICLLFAWPHNPVMAFLAKLMGSE